MKDCGLAINSFTLGVEGQPQPSLLATIMYSPVHQHLLCTTNINNIEVLMVNVAVLLHEKGTFWSLTLGI
jgi:hypothetical protein